MSLAIKFGDNNDPDQLSGFIYFDVVTKYSKQLSGKVTSHPLDAGASITDHYISENPKYNIVGVISSADISNVPNSITVDGESPFNVNPQPSAVSVGNSGSGLLKAIPGVSSGFLTSGPEQISMDSNVKVDYGDQVKNLLQKLMTGLVYNENEKKLRNKMTLITLYEFYGNILGIEAENLVMTSCAFDEDPDSGNGVFISMSLEQVSFVTLQKTELPKDVSASLSKSSQSTAKKSKADGTEKKVGDSSDATSTDPGPKLSRNELNELELREAKKAKEALKAKQ